MAEKTEKKMKNTATENPMMMGFKWGFGFWIAALAAFVLLSVAFLLLSYVL